MFIPLYSNNEPPTPSFTPIGDEPTNPVTLITPTTNSTGSSNKSITFLQNGEFFFTSCEWSKIIDF